MEPEMIPDSAGVSDFEYLDCITKMDFSLRMLSRWNTLAEHDNT